MKKPLLYTATAFLAGVYLGGWERIPIVLLALVGGFLLLYLLVGCVKPKIFNWYFILTLLCFSGVAYHQLVMANQSMELVQKAGEHVTIRGFVAEEPQVRDHRVSYLVVVEEYRVGSSGAWHLGNDEKVLIYQKNPKDYLGYGEGVEVKGRLTLPGVAGNPGQLDYSAYLKKQGIGTLIYLNGQEGLAPTGEIGGNPLSLMAIKVKSNLTSVAADTLEKSEADLVNGLVFGLRDGLEGHINDLFQRIGLIHILSVSGLHVGMVTVAFFFLFRLLGVPERLTVIFNMMAVLGYGFLIGLGPPVARAVVMMELILLSRVLQRRNHWPTALALSAMLITLVNPAAIYLPGFQLSFVATWGILYLVPVLWDTLIKYGFPSENAWLKILLFPLAAQLATWPLTAYYFNLASPIALLANLLLSSIVAPITWLGLFAALLGQLSAEVAWFINGSTAVLVKILIWTAGVLDKLPGGSFNIKSPPEWLIVFWYGSLFGWGSYIEKQGFALKAQVIWQKIKDTWQDEVPKWAGNWSLNTTLTAFIMAIIILWGTGLADSRSNLEVTFLDVGEGDCIFLKTPEGRNILIDAGRGSVGEGSFDAGAKIVTPFLQKRGINRLDALVVTHHHFDHGGGVGAVLDKFPVDMVIMPPAEALENQLEESYKPILEKIKKKVPKVETVQQGDRLELGEDLIADILGPLEPVLLDTTADLNNNALVIKLVYRNKSFLFTSDIELPMVEQLLKSKADLRAQVLKVPHHGSIGALSMDFYRQVGAQWGVIDVGPNNFGHPHQQVIDALAEQGTKVLRTDLQGAITFKTDGHNLMVDTYKGKE